MNRNDIRKFWKGETDCYWLINMQLVIRCFNFWKRMLMLGSRILFPLGVRWHYLRNNSRRTIILSLGSISHLVSISSFLLPTCGHLPSRKVYNLRSFPGLYQLFALLMAFGTSYRENPYYGMHSSHSALVVYGTPYLFR
jgi:hypothetical protein